MNTILIADDKNENRYVLKNFFKLFGESTSLHIIEASTAKDSFELIQTHKPRLVLMDIKMESEYAGLDVLKEIRKMPELQSVKIWAITAHALEANESDKSDKDKFLEAGFDDFLSKPFDPVILLSKISKLLNLDLPEKVKKKLNLAF